MPRLGCGEGHCLTLRKPLPFPEPPLPTRAVGIGPGVPPLRPGSALGPKLKALKGTEASLCGPPAGAGPLTQQCAVHVTHSELQGRGSAPSFP